MRPRVPVLLLAIGGACLALVGPASTAQSASSVVLGSSPSSGTLKCGGSGGNLTVLPQALGPSAPQYVATFDGVISSMSYSAGTVLVGTQVRAVFVKPAGGNSYTVQEKSPLFPMVAGRVSTYQIRLTVHVGDYLALNVTGPGADDLVPCFSSSAGSSVVLSVSAVDSTSTLTPSMADVPGIADISAVLEPDADHDGYGDVTQDQCPTSAQDQGPCPDRTAPDTTVTRKPPSKTSQHKATVKFTSPDATATFECALDSKVRYKACTSPWKVKAGLGKHKLFVRALDPAGNVDLTPVKVTWRVIQKRPRSTAARWERPA